MNKDQKIAIAIVVLFWLAGSAMFAYSDSDCGRPFAVAVASVFSAVASAVIVLIAYIDKIK